MALQLTLAGCTTEAGWEACLEGSSYVSGAVLAKMLAEATGIGRWFLGPTPLDRIGALPDHGHLLLCTSALAEPECVASPLTADARDLYLVAVGGPDPGRRLPLLRGEHTLGRAGSDLCVADPGLSRNHARIVVDTLGVRVSDLESGNGISVSGRRVPSTVLLEGEEFNAGQSTFRVLGATTLPPPADRLWPQEPVTLDVQPPTARLLPQALGALLPMLVGIGLFVATGTWYFLAFCAIGLATGGVSVVSGLRERRRYRRSLAQAVAVDERRRRALAPSVGEAAQQFRYSPRSSYGPAAEVLCVGMGTAPANIHPGSLIRGTAIPSVHEVPCFLPCSPGSLGLLVGPAPAVHTLVRAMLLRLTPDLLTGTRTLVVAGNASFLPVEVRRIPGVVVLDRTPTALDCPPGALLFFCEPDAASSASVRELTTAPGGPGIVLIRPCPEWQSSDWCVDAGSGRVSAGPRDYEISVDRLGTAVLRDLLVSILPAPGWGPLPVPAPTPLLRGSDSTHRLCTQISLDGATPVELDLVADGPHLLIAGTTGSGKSELLRTLVLGWCEQYSSTDLALMLIDFKGGSALGPLGALPHVQSMVTDLDGDGAARALESLGAELRRRESLLAEVGAGDYSEYRSLAGDDDVLLPRLIVVVDEFRVLGTELPDATDRLIRLATIGRSLGVHLVLATQRPQGAIPAELRANINAVICLRLQSEFESSDLLGSPAAARLDPAAPGSALLRRGTGAVQAFRVSDRTGPGATPRLLVFGPTLTRPRVVVGPATARQQPVEELVRTMSLLFATEQIPANPFPAPLPPVLTVLPQGVCGTAPEHGIGLGMVDLVADQRCVGWFWDPTTMGRLAVIGHPSSGTAQLLSQLVAGLPRIGARAFILDGTGTLAGWARAPQIAGYVGVSEPDRVIDVIGLLDDPGGAAVSLLLVTGMAGWAGTMEAQAYLEFDAFLADHARRSRDSGAALILVGDRDAAAAKVYALCEHRLFLPLGSGPETTIGWPALRPVAKIAGRAIWLGPGTPATGHTLQLLTSQVAPPVAGQPDSKHGYPEPLCSPLPLKLAPADLRVPATITATDSRGHLVGVSGPDNRPWFWRPGPVAVVLGRLGSGKSSLLALLAAGSGSNSQLFRLGQAMPEAAGALGDEPVAGVELVLIDDADADPTRASRLLERASARGLRVVLAACPSQSLGYTLPVGPVLRSGESVLVLGYIGRAESELLGFRVPELPRGIPGRGVVLDAGRVRRIQCLTPPDPD